MKLTTKPAKGKQTASPRPTFRKLLSEVRRRCFRERWVLERVKASRLRPSQHHLPEPRQQFSVLSDAGCDLTFGEKAVSTVAAEKRPELQRALKALNSGDTLVVSKLDRLGRTQSEVVARLADLQAKGVFVRTLDGLLNIAGLGKLALLVVGLLTDSSEVERNLTVERTRESVEHRRRTGGVGRTPTADSGTPATGEAVACRRRVFPQSLALGVSVSTAHRYRKEAAVA